MRALGLPLPAAAGWDDGLGVMDAVLLLGASALTCLLLAAVVRAAARTRVHPRGAQPHGFTLVKGAGWLQTTAAGLAAVAVLVLVWTLVLRLVALT